MKIFRSFHAKEQRKRTASCGQRVKRIFSFLWKIFLEEITDAMSLTDEVIATQLGRHEKQLPE
ncbi:MAG: hypothetical protein H7Y86_10185 [Rhizobacter sp.]|nr:hypothetical protein [Ferruginibacter sp.]